VPIAGLSHESFCLGKGNGSRWAIGEQQKVGDRQPEPGNARFKNRVKAHYRIDAPQRIHGHQRQSESVETGWNEYQAAKPPRAPLAPDEEM
jgi:hypothetical protein